MVGTSFGDVAKEIQEYIAFLVMMVTQVCELLITIDLYTLGEFHGMWIVSQQSSFKKYVLGM